MTGYDKKTKSDVAAKSDAPPKEKSETPPKNKGVQETAPSEASSGQEQADPSAGYSRGEGQKPVSKAYKDNWNLIFGAKKER
jgi:hypothetical protein